MLNNRTMEDCQSHKTSDAIFASVRKYQHEEYQYIRLLERILDHGAWEDGRNGRTKGVFGASMRFSLANGRVPLLTTKKTAWKTCLKELLWFIRGETDNRILKAQGVHIWDANASREFLDAQGLTDYQADELGPIYGAQWRAFNKPYTPRKHLDNVDKERDEGVDQLQDIICALQDPTQRASRRLVMSAWNPCQLNQMALPPCHVLCQFRVTNGDQLSCAMYQRSNDECCGTPFNIASYSFLTHLLAVHCGLKAHEFVYFKGDCHIYEGHVEGAKTQIQREPFEFPTVSIAQVREKIEDYQVEDFAVHDYQHHPQIPFQMVA